MGQPSFSLQIQPPENATPELGHGFSVYLETKIRRFKNSDWLENKSNEA